MKLKTILAGIAVSFLIPVIGHQTHTEGSVVVPDVKLAQVIEIDLKPVETALKKPVVCEPFHEILEKYDWDASVMAAIMRAESGCNTGAIGDTWVISGLYAPSCGLFQIRTLAGRPDCESLKDPSTNIEWAYKIYKGQGLAAWSVYSNGEFKKYL